MFMFVIVVLFCSLYGLQVSLVVGADDVPPGNNRGGRFQQHILPIEVKHDPKEELEISDAKCSVESVQYANSKQLQSILEELLNTTYFRLWKVNLKKECPFWKPPNSTLTSSSTSTSESTTTDGGDGGGGANEEEKCAGVDSFIDLNASPVSICSLNLNEGTPAATTTEEAQCKENDNEKRSSKEDSYFTSKQLKWSPPTDAIDKRISPQEGAALTRSKQEDGCTDEDENSPTFWLNICHDIDTESSSEMINLKLNPEQYTGYNGSHIWQAIYEENCFVRSGSEKHMCYEERVLYRLLSGMHTSINIHISLSYFPPLKGKRVWMPNPQRFVDHYSEHPERLLNLHFGFVVLLRALFIAMPHLEEYPFSTGNVLEDKRTKMLIQRLLESHVLSKCGEVFSAFDESMLFKGETVGLHDTRLWHRGLTMDGRLLSLKQQFKGVFRNISRLLDCVSCQKCKLHAKLQLLGIGTALKILLSPEKQQRQVVLSLTREEVVALINTIGRWSNAITGVQELAKLYQASLNSMQPLTNTKITVPPTETENKQFVKEEKGDNVDKTVGLIVELANEGKITRQQEEFLVDLALAQDNKIMILSKYYFNQPYKFLAHALNTQSSRTMTTTTTTPVEEKQQPSKGFDAIVVGGGLAGLTTVITLLDRGATVAVIEKENFFGGNSAWASSGINGVRSNHTSSNDSVEKYYQDTLRASGYNSTSDGLIRLLTSKSGDAVDWLSTRVGVAFTEVGQLGGHSYARTHRPKSGLAGSELIFTLSKLIEKGKWGEKLKIFKKTRVTSLIQNEKGHVIGVNYVDISGTTKQLFSRDVVLATGGYTNDRGGSGDTSIIAVYAPQLLGFPTTNGKWTTGDGHKMAMRIGAATVELENVQVHPTGFVDPQKPDDETKTLCAEILRGVGGILLDNTGKRFCDELGTRDYITDKMLEAMPTNPKFTILLNEAASKEAETHTTMYRRKNLLHKFDDVSSLATFLSVPPERLLQTFDEYNAGATLGSDQFNKTHFHNMPWTGNGPFYVGTVTPVLHYCMGGLRINEHGQVLYNSGARIVGLYAAGEMVGGIHGRTRLGGNALSECVVFGRIIGQEIDLTTPPTPTGRGEERGYEEERRDESENKLKRVIEWKEVEQHNKKEDCWVVIESLVYDFTEFVGEHPGGMDAVVKLAGKDGTHAFLEVHNVKMLVDFEDKIMGIVKQQQ